MRKTMLAGVLALAMMGSSSFAGQGFIVTEGQIAYFKSTLNLRPEQEPYWMRVEAVLRDVARRQQTDGTALDASAIQRVISSAMPLFQRLDAEQKQDAMRLARALGISSLASLF